MAGYVYLIGTPTFRWYKIGKSITPELRIQNLGILLPFKISIVGIWKAANHTAMESALHDLYASSRINGEWFKFSKKEVLAICDSLPQSARIFPSPNSANSVFANFSNIERDCAVDEVISFRIRKMRGDFTPEERETRRWAAIRRQQERRALNSLQ